MIAGDRLGHLDQVALATERPAIDARVLGGIELRIHPGRGLDVGAAWFRGLPLAWIAAAGEGGAESRDWRAAWDGGARVETDAAEVRARDEDAAPHDWSTAPPQPASLPERVWEHVGATRGVVVNERLGLRVAIESDLPRLWQWVDPAPGVYALGIEPANCSVLGRAHDRAEGRLPFLQPGEERGTRIAISVEEVE